MTSAKILDYLHFYIGSTILRNGSFRQTLTINLLQEIINKAMWDQVQLELRPIASATDEEKAFLGYTGTSEITWTPEKFVYACKHTLDAFDLIPSGLAVENQ